MQPTVPNSPEALSRIAGTVIRAALAVQGASCSRTRHSSRPWPVRRLPDGRVVHIRDRRRRHANPDDRDLQTVNL